MLEFVSGCFLARVTGLKYSLHGMEIEENG